MPGHLRVFILYTAAYFLSYFYRSANAVIAPDLSSEMGLNAGQLGLMTSLFFVTFAIAQLPLGIGLDKWGPRWVTPGLMLLGVAGSLIFAVAPSFAVLALGRGLIGAGMAGVLMGSFKAFSQWYSPGRFATVSGLLVGIGSTGALIAATPLAWLNNTIGWRAVFAIGGVVTFLIALSIVLWTRSSPPGVPRPDRNDSESKLKEIFTDIRFWRIAPLNFFMAGTMLAFQGLWAGPYLFDAMRLNEIETGNILLLMGIGVTVGFMVSGWLCDRLGTVRVIATGGIIFMVAQFILVMQPPLAAVALVYILFGVSGSFNIMLMAHARQIFPPAMTGQAVTAANLFGISGTFLLQWWMGLIIGSFPANAAGHYPPQAYSAALLFTATGTLLTLIWYLPLARKG